METEKILTEIDSFFAMDEVKTIIKNAKFDTDSCCVLNPQISFRMYKAGKGKVCLEITNNSENNYTNYKLTIPA